MRRPILIAALLCTLASACATAHRTAGENCCLVAGAVGVAAVVGLAGAALDSVLDPEPKIDDSVESQRRHFDWQQRQNSQSTDYD